MTESGNVLPEVIIQKIEAEAGKYPTRRAAVKSALRYAQAEFGWISEDVVKAVAEVLDLERIEVFEVATFYDMFYTRPVGRFPVRVCTNVSCLLRGADDIMNSLCQRLGVEAGETTADGRFTVFPAECLGACGGGQLMAVGDDYHEDLEAGGLAEILERYR